MKYFLFHKKADCPLQKKKKGKYRIKKGNRGARHEQNSFWYMDISSFTQKPKLGN